jgi:hypothetical protein
MKDHRLRLAVDRADQQTTRLGSPPPRYAEPAHDVDVQVLHNIVI